jgi:hypothetical protein
MTNLAVERRASEFGRFFGSVLRANAAVSPSRRAGRRAAAANRAFEPMLPADHAARSG